MMIKKFRSFVAGLFVLHRFETVFFVAPLAAWGPLLAFGGGHSDVRLAWLAFVLNVGTAYSGFLGNSYCDYELDRRAPEKRTITGAMNAIGHRNALVLFLMETLLLVILFYVFHAAYASLYADFWFWFGMFGRYLYNFPPFRLKERGVLNMISYATNFGVTPFFLAWSLFYDSYPIGFLCVAAAGFLVMASQSLWGAAVDYESDKRSKATTVAVALGLRRSLGWSQWLMVVSAPLMVFGIYKVLSLQGIRAGALTVGLLAIMVGYGYSILDRVRYVILADEFVIHVRLQHKFRQLAWLVAQTGLGLAGLLVMVSAKPT